MVQAITDQEFESSIANGVSLIDFWAPWCGPCRMQMPIVEELSEKLGDVDFYKMNVDEEKEVAAKFRIMSIPTLLVAKDGEIVETLVGFHDADSLEKVLTNHL